VIVCSPGIKAPMAHPRLRRDIARHARRAARWIRRSELEEVTVDSTAAGTVNPTFVSVKGPYVWTFTVDS